MLTLMLLRHAKAVQAGRGDDFARALTDRGERDALAVGAHMAGVGLLPDLALVSASRRTRQTFDLVAKGAGASLVARVEESLYNASETQLCDALRLVDPGRRTLLIVGHNPGVMDAASRLSREGEAAELTRLRNRFPPCALAVISFDALEWRDARSGGRLDLLLMPEDFSPG